MSNTNKRTHKTQIKKGVSGVQGAAKAQTARAKNDSSALCTQASDGVADDTREYRPHAAQIDELMIPPSLGSPEPYLFMQDDSYAQNAQQAGAVTNTHHLSQKNNVQAVRVRNEQQSTGTHSSASGNHGSTAGTHSNAAGTHSSASGTRSSDSDTHSSASGTHSSTSGTHSSTSGTHSGDIPEEGFRNINREVYRGLKQHAFYPGMAYSGEQPYLLPDDSLGEEDSVVERQMKEREEFPYG